VFLFLTKVRDCRGKEGARLAVHWGSFTMKRKKTAASKKLQPKKPSCGKEYKGKYRESWAGRKEEME